MVADKQKKIGGFIGLDLPLAKPDGRSAWEVMTQDTLQTFCAGNVRGVLAGLLQDLAPSRVWYPAYCCPEIALEPKGIERLFYPVGANLQPDVKWLGDRLDRGDAVLSISYFGLTPADEFKDLARTHPDVLWIEDCSQSLLPGKAWSDWRLFSPRKIFGVPDGGIGVCLNAEKTMQEIPTSPPQSNLSVPEKLMPLLWRMEDAEEGLNDLWYSAYQSAEALPHDLAQHEAISGMSGLSRRLLDAIDAKFVIEARCANAQLLHKLFPNEIRLWNRTPLTPLLGYPIRVSQRDEVAKHLSEEGIFCAVHWRTLPSDPAQFPVEHQLSGSLLTIPCDQRYNQEDMYRIAKTLATLT